MNGVRVVKVGGSLLDFAGLAAALRTWLARQPPLATVLVAGGGPFTDAVRAADERFALSEETSHWLCIDALAVSARLLAGLLPEAEFLPRCTVRELLQRLTATSPGSTFVFDIETYLREEEPRHSKPLPHTWSVTSDSLAARLAEALEVEELVLVKSGLPSIAALHSAAEAGYVDPYFPQAAARLRRVRCVNLRSKELEELTLQ